MTTSISQTRLLLVRHGETASNSAGLFSGSQDVPLTPTGQKQAEALARRLHTEHIDALYCSSQRRARETATPTATALNLPIQIRDGLREMNFGEWEARSRADLLEHYPQQMAYWASGSWQARPPGGETQQEVIMRVASCIMEILERHHGQTILVVTHMTALRLLLANMLDISLRSSKALRIQNATLTEVQIMDDQVRLVTYNDGSHLLAL